MLKRKRQESISQLERGDRVVAIAEGSGVERFGELQYRIGIGDDYWWSVKVDGFKHPMAFRDSEMKVQK